MLYPYDLFADHILSITPENLSSIHDCQALFPSTPHHLVYELTPPSRLLPSSPLRLGACSLGHPSWGSGISGWQKRER